MIKNTVTYTVMVLIVFTINFAIFNYSFNMQATPFLQEEQRVESALMMLKTTLPAYLVAALVITAMFYLLATRLNKKA